MPALSRSGSASELYGGNESDLF